MLPQGKNKVPGCIKQGGGPDSAHGPCVCHLCFRSTGQCWGHSSWDLLLPALLSTLGSLLFSCPLAPPPCLPVPETPSPLCDQDSLLVSFTYKDEYDIVPALKKTMSTPNSFLCNALNPVPSSDRLLTVLAYWHQAKSWYYKEEIKKTAGQN